MITFIAIICAAIAGYFYGRHSAAKEGYDQAMRHVQDVIVKLEKLYRNSV